jgi:hypothetical protein
MAADGRAMAHGLGATRRRRTYRRSVPTACDGAWPGRIRRHGRAARCRRTLQRSRGENHGGSTPAPDPTEPRPAPCVLQGSSRRDQTVRDRGKAIEPSGPARRIKWRHLTARSSRHRRPQRPDDYSRSGEQSDRSARTKEYDSPGTGTPRRTHRTLQGSGRIILVEPGGTDRRRREKRSNQTTTPGVIIGQIRARNMVATPVATGREFQHVANQTLGRNVL